jgi:PAS domain S-box-containing protein
MATARPTTITTNATGDEQPTPARPRDDPERPVPARAAELAEVNRALQAEIAERGRIEADARRRARFLESIIENVPDMIFVKDAHDLRFVRFNRAGEELLGYRREALLGKSDHDFFPPAEADFFIAKDRDVLAGGKLVDIPAEPIHTRERGTRLLHTKKIPILDDAGRPAYLLGISEDITERRQTEEALANKASELARTNAELEQFAYIASHDLQEPLRKIQAFGDVLASTAGAALGPEARDYLARMQSAAGRMQALINDLLAFSRATSRALPFVAVDLAAVVRDVLTDLEVRVLETGARVDLGELPEVHADPMQLRQLLQNLIANALKFHRDGERPVVRITSAEVPGGREIVVEDDGIGLDEKYADRIFRPFQRLHGREQYEGTGIGLAICKKIVDHHRGAIRVRSSPGNGATFVVTLPESSGEATRSP